MDVNISLPLLYPNDRPDVRLHCGGLSKTGHETLNESMREYLENLEPGTLCMMSAIEWVRDNFRLDSNQYQVEPLAEREGTEYARLWIASHHIYSKMKIRNIVAWAKELDLTGFLLAGKPGFVCIEGTKPNCHEWWQRVSI